MKDRPGYAQCHKGLSEPNFVSKQNHLPSAFVIAVVKTQQYGIDGTLLPTSCRFYGWRLADEKVGKSSGGGAWTRKRYSSDPALGPKRLWI